MLLLSLQDKMEMGMQIKRVSDWKKLSWQTVKSEKKKLNLIPSKPNYIKYEGE